MCTVLLVVPYTIHCLNLCTSEYQAPVGRKHAKREYCLQEQAPMGRWGSLGRWLPKGRFFGLSLVANYACKSHSLDTTV